MFTQPAKPISAQGQFRQAAEKFLQAVDFTEEEQPWALVLLNTMGEMIEANDRQQNTALKEILIKKILEDLEYIMTSGKYENNTNCADFAQAIRSYINHLKQLTPAEGAGAEVAHHQQQENNQDPADGSDAAKFRVQP